MKEKNCIFCRIASGDAPSYKIYEDGKYLAFLDLFPNIEGQALLIPKDHKCSLFSEIEDRELSSFVLVAKKVANLMRKKLKVARVHLVFEGPAFATCTPSSTRRRASPTASSRRSSRLRASTSRSIPDT